VARADRGEWAKRVQRWQESGLTAREFADEMGLKATSLSFWRWRLKKDRSLVVKPPKRAQLLLPKTAKAVGLVELTAPARGAVTFARGNEARFELVIGEYIIRIPNGFDDVTLRRLLSALRERP
jgi:transposase